MSSSKFTHFLNELAVPLLRVNLQYISKPSKFMTASWWESRHVTKGDQGKGTTMTHNVAETSTVKRSREQLQHNRWIDKKIITRGLEWLWFLDSGWFATIMSSGHGAINKELKQIPDKLNVWRDSAVITKQTSQWDYLFPWAALLSIIRCDILPPPRCSAAEWLNQPINHRFHPFHHHRWPLLKSCDQVHILRQNTKYKNVLMHFLGNLHIHEFTLRQSLYGSSVFCSEEEQKHVLILSEWANEAVCLPVFKMSCKLAKYVCLSKINFSQVIEVNTVNLSKHWTWIQTKTKETSHETGFRSLPHH